MFFVSITIFIFGPLKHATGGIPGKTLKSNQMSAFTLTKTAKGKEFIYTVKDEAGKVISTRVSKRDYIACTTNGEFYFGRLDLIQKGDHGRAISIYRSRLTNPEKAQKKGCEWMNPSDKQEYYKRCPLDKYIKDAQDSLAALTQIAYLK